MLRGRVLHRDKMLTGPGSRPYSCPMDQTQPDGQLRRVDSALTRLETMVDERLRSEQERSDDLARRLLRLEEQDEDLKKVAMDVEGRLERAMEYIRSLLAADQQ